MSRFLRILVAGVAIFALTELHAWAKQVTRKPVTVEDIGPGKESGSDAARQIPFDPKAATDAYLARVPRDEKARSDAYSEGGYWLLLWKFLYVVAVLGLLLHSGWSARFRNTAERITRLKALQPGIYWLQFLVVTSLLVFPLTLYRGYFREHKYGLATQTFGPWLGDQFKGLLVVTILGGVLVIAIFGVIRRSKNNWWIWASVVTIILSMFIQLIAPIYIFPLFNKYTVLNDEKIKQPILSMARANGISVNDIYQVDASRQSKRISANVSGFLGTERITLNDNLLKRCSLPEIEAVMGHEMGHYVLNHVYKHILFFSVLTVVGFAFLRCSVDWCLKRWGSKWQVRGIDDPAVLPLAVLLGLIFAFVLTPVTNTYIRTGEYEADIFGLNASRQPDAEAEVALKFGEYRKLDPSPLEEWIFYDHPSGRTRIYSAMRWKAENLR